MPVPNEQHQPSQEVEAREEDGPEPPEPAPRGNVHSEPDDSRPGEMPPPQPN